MGFCRKRGHNSSEEQGYGPLFGVDHLYRIMCVCVCVCVCVCNGMWVETFSEKLGFGMGGCNIKGLNKLKNGTTSFCLKSSFFANFCTGVYMCNIVIAVTSQNFRIQVLPLMGAA